MNGRTLDHIGIAVESLDAAIELWSSRLGWPLAGPRERVEDQGVEVVFLGQGPGRIELLAPVHPESPVARFLQRRGPGMHHLCYRVPDLEAALSGCAEAGIELVDHVPRRGAGGHRVAFLHPRSTGGVLIELLQA